MRLAFSLLAASLVLSGCAAAPGAPTDPADVVVVDIRPPAQPHAANAEADAGVDEAPPEVSLAILGALGSSDEVVVAFGDVEPVDIFGRAIGAGVGGLGLPGAVIEVGAPMVVGGLSVDAAALALRSRRPEMQTCHSLGLARDRTLHGSVALRFEVDPTGAVQSLTEGSSTISDREVVLCLLRAMTTLRFPAATAPSTITAPIFLRPSPAMHP